MKRLLIPSNLDIAEIRKMHLITFKGFVEDKAFFVCDAIYKGYLRLKRRTMTHPLKDKPYYVPLQSAILKYYLGNEYYKDILNWMITAGIIETDGKYLPELVSIGYRFTEEYRNAGFLVVDVKDFTLYTKAPFDKKAADVVPMSPTVKRLRRCYSGLKIDFALAHMANDVLYADGLSVGGGGELQAINSSDATNAHKHLCNQIVLEQFKTGNAEYHFQDKFGLRLHNIITRLPRAFRGLVTYNDKHLAQTDISNSQLFFALYLFNRQNWKKTKKRGHIWNGVGVSYPPSFSPLSIMCSKSSKSPYSGCFQDEVFFEKVTSGTIYGFLTEKMEAVEGFFDGCGDDCSHRDYVKKLFLSQMYADEYSIGDRPLVFTSVPDTKERQYRMKSKLKLRNNMWLYSGMNLRLWETFRKVMPVAAGIFSHIKSYDYPDLAMVLQRIESTAVLEYACKDIFAELGDIPLFTLHDCLVTTEDNVKRVDTILKDAIFEFVKAYPSTEIKYWKDYQDLLPFSVDLAA